MQNKHRYLRFESREFATQSFRFYLSVALCFDRFCKSRMGLQKCLINFCEFRVGFEYVSKVLLGFEQVCG